MLGIEDPVVVLGYIVVIILVIVSLLYGWFNRDKGEDKNG